MEQQTFKTSLTNLLKNKSSESTTYRKALTIYESILQSTRDIPNFQLNYANSDSNFALFVFGSVFKLLGKDNKTMKHNVDSLLLLINQTLPMVNVSTIKTTGILKQLQKTVFTLLKEFQGDERTPLMIRLAIAVLSYTLVNTDKIQNDKQAMQILCGIFDFSVDSHRSNILSKQSSKMLTHLAKDNPNIAKILSKHANMTMLSNIQQNLYLNNVREVIAEFPLQLINDVGYRVCKHLSTIQCTSENQQTYLAQTYFFLQKLASKFSASTLQQICKQLLSNVPSSAKSQSKVVFCYIQAVHAVFQAFLVMNQRAAYKYISVLVSILQQFITKGGRIEKQSSGIMRSIMANCIRKSLWVNSTKSTDQLDFQIFENMGLQQVKGNSFNKLIYLLQGMLGDQYPNFKATANILSSFFDSLDKTAFDHVIGLVDKIVNFRDKFDDRSYKNVMHSIFRALSIKSLCQIYKVGVNGDISDQSFESKNNLWLVYCTQKYDGDQDFHTYMVYYFPLLAQLKTIIANPNLPPIRIQAYKMLIQMFWRCLKVFCKKPNENYNYETIIQAIKAQVTIANDSTLDHIAMALQNLCSNLFKTQYQCKWAGNLISLLAKNLDLEKSNAKQILRAIKYLSTISDKQYLNKVFDKNIVKLIQQKQKGTLHHAENVQNNLKNMQILIAVSNGINFYDPTVIAPYRISREELVVRLIGDLIADTGLFQKKAYKYIFETLGLMGQSYLNQIVGLLQVYQHKIMAASKHYRLAILMHLWNKLSQTDDTINEAFEFMKKYLPQILMDMRQSNQRARKQATTMFESFCSKILQIGLMENFVQIMCAGLAVDASQTKVSTLNGLAEIYTQKYELSIEFSLGILQIVLMLLYEQKSQIYKAIIDFSRRFIFSLEKTKQINHILSTILEQLFKTDLNSKLQNRCVLKHLLLKLTRKFGRDLVQKYIPAEDRKILSNAIKTENREKKKQKQRRMQRRLQAQRLRNENQSSSEDEQNEMQEQGEGMDIEDKKLEQLKQLQNTDNLLLKYDLQKQNFHFQQDKLQLKNKLKDKNANNRQQDITFENGLMVVKEDPRRTRQKRNQNQQQKQQQNIASSGYVNTKKKRKLNDVHDVKQSGATFKSNRAGGDVQLKDKPQPYAFIQFNSKALNKRFKKRAEKVFDTIFERHEGGLKGIKSKIANRR